ncbi:MAG: hypothetical protein ABJE66_17870 [Deltaproteobacteria bacterium]
MVAKASKAIKVCLTNSGDDVETPWAHDLGPAPGPKGSRKVRLVNVPFMHAKPTWGDVVVVTPVKDGFPTWDRSGVTWSDIASRIHEDGGRWAMIVDYESDADAEECFDAIAHACAELDAVCEGAWAPNATRAGRVYLAVKTGTTDKAVMNHLGRAELPCMLAQIHPTPTAAAPAAKPTARGSARKPAKRAAPTKPTKKRATARR